MKKKNASISLTVESNTIININSTVFGSFAAYYPSHSAARLEIVRSKFLFKIILIVKLIFSEILLNKKNL